MYCFKPLRMAKRRMAFRGGPLRASSAGLRMLNGMTIF